MRKDSIIDEIHKFREEHARKFNYDFDAIFASLRSGQSQRQNVTDLLPVKPAVARVAEPHAGYGVASMKNEPKKIQ